MIKSKTFVIACDYSVGHHAIQIVLTRIEGDRKANIQTIEELKSANTKMIQQLKKENKELIKKKAAMKTVGTVCIVRD